MPAAERRRISGETPERATDSPQVRLDLDLATQLVLDAGLLQLRLEQDLDGDDELARLLARQIHAAELARAERLADVEVVDRPPLDRRAARRFRRSDDRAAEFENLTVRRKKNEKSSR